MSNAARYLYASLTFTLSPCATKICVSTPSDTTVHLTRGTTGEEEEVVGMEDRDTKQGMEMELPNGAETGPEWGMFTWRDWTSSAEKKIEDPEREEQKGSVNLLRILNHAHSFKCTFVSFAYN